jgi:hypothetical protein
MNSNVEIVGDSEGKEQIKGGFKGVSDWEFCIVVLHF